MPCCPTVPSGCLSAWNQAHMGQKTHCISMPAARALLPHAPQGPGLLLEDGTASSAGAPILVQLPVPAPSPQLTAWSSAYKTLSLRCVPHHPHNIISHSRMSYQGMKPPAAQGAHHPSRPHTALLPSPAFHWHPKTNWNVSKYRPHLYSSHPNFTEH